MLGSSDIVAFASSTDLEVARGFYQKTLGLRFVEQNEYACVFDVNATMLRISWAAEVAKPGYTVLGWRVTDIEHTVDQLTEKGVVFNRYAGMDQDPRAIWTAPGGDKVAWFSDPDGNTLSLTQFT